MVKAEHISLNDQMVAEQPSDGHRIHIVVNLDDWKEVKTLPDNWKLPLSSQQFPMGSPLESVIKVGNKIYEKK